MKDFQIPSHLSAFINQYKSALILNMINCQEILYFFYVWSYVFNNY